MQTIHISEINNAGIVTEARKAGLSAVSFIGEYEHPDHPGSSDWMIRLYEVNGVRVAGTNGEPLWEEDNQEAFKELLKEYDL